MTIFCCPECPNGHSPMCIKCPVRARAENYPQYEDGEDEAYDEECPNTNAFLGGL